MYVYKSQEQPKQNQSIIMSYAKVLELVLTLAFLLSRPAAARFSDCDAYDCFTNATYRSESLNVLRINTLLESLSTNIDDDGFYRTSVEDGQINGLALCRGDIELEYCSNCLREIGRQIKDECPRAVQAIRWSELCMLRYSNETISEKATEAPVKHLWSDQNITTSPDRFKEARAELIEELRHLAVTGDRRSAFGKRPLPDGDNRTVYGMAQCTQDLSAEECDGCLANATKEILGCCDNTMGARVYTPSCILRYESDEFYNVVAKGKGKAKKATARNIAIAVISSVASIVLIIVCIVMLLKKRRKQNPKQVDPIESEVAYDDQIDTTESIQYEFEKIRVATNDFSLDNKLGQGGFGVVYKGKLSNGQQIAVKRLSKNSGQGDEEFKNEVALVAKLQHRNLVRMLGFSQQGNEKLLIYEFVSNGSLDCFIFDQIKRLELDYNKRIEIIRGIAKGILYLHEDSRLRIIHRDLKASNVLLDEDMNPKISDFGMARLVGEDGTQDNTNRIVGTYGYMAPEYANHGLFSIKSDTFSFGVVVLEIITGMKRIFRDNDGDLEHLSTYVWRNWCEGMTTNIIDSPLRMSDETQQIVLRCIHIALLCVQENANNRPTMASVVLLLNSASLPLPMPFPPAFSTPAQSPEASRTHSSSITTLYPR